MIGAEPLQAGLAGAGDMVARRAEIVRAGADREGRFGRDQCLVAAPLEGEAQDLLGRAGGIAVGGVEEIDPGLQTQIDEARRFGDIGAAPALEEFVGAAERAGAEAEDGDLEAGAAELAIFHGRLSQA